MQTRLEMMMPSVPALVSIALRPLPLAPLQLLLTALLDGVVQQHPGIFERLGEHVGKRIGIDPTDLPFAFVLEPRPGASRIVAVGAILRGTVDARIAGPLAGLIGLANGTLDGDALFFSRDLTIEGDVETIVALRNAMDDAGVDIVRDASASLGAFGPLLERVGRIAAIVAEKLVLDVRGRQWN
jgi:predicted lipid carrier protein YhbT